MDQNKHEVLVQSPNENDFVLLMQLKIDSKDEKLKTMNEKIAKISEKLMSEEHLQMNIANDMQLLQQEDVTFDQLAFVLGLDIPPEPSDLKYDLSVNNINH